MDTVPLDLAFSRLGADVGGRYRPLWATAQDGSLVLVCQSSGFSRSAPGVLRYSALLSRTPARASQLQGLRQTLDTACSGATAVRLIIQTPGVGKASSRFHVRADLVGSVTAFDGDAYSVDFVQLPDPEAVPAVSARRRR
jgi:hypothetical protein